jgi:hypothetical protein
MTSTQTTDRKIPKPLYAAAGAGDLAYEKLRKLPGKVSELRDRVEKNDITIKVDVDKIRAAAKRNAAALRASALTAQDKATAVYTDLVARGEQVVRAGRSTAGDRVEKVAEITADKAAAIAPERKPVVEAKPKKAAPKK